jgi:sugar-phosphatase
VDAAARRDAPRPVEAAIFDMDGVLVDSEPLWREVELEVFGGLGLRLTETMLHETMGMRTNEVVEHWLHRHPDVRARRDEVAERLVDGMVRAVRSHGAAAPGAIEAIAFFERHGLALALASSSPRRLIEGTLAACGLDGRFGVVRSAEDEPRGKPDPGVFLSAATDLGVDPPRCLVVEDSPAGVRAAKAAGMVCVVVPPPAVEAAVREAGADAVLPSLADLDETIWSTTGIVPAGGGR